MTEVWPMQRRTAVSKLLTKEAARVRRKTKANHVVIIAMLPADDPKYYHAMDASDNWPGDMEQFYRMMASNYERLRTMGEGYTQ